MKLLRRPKPYTDESLESYLTRLSAHNGYLHFSVLWSLVRAELASTNHSLAKELPTELAKINLCHANISSIDRYKALISVSHLVLKDTKLIISLALMRSTEIYSKGLTSLFRDGVCYPRIFLRTTGVPICTDCLREEAYIPQYWHFKPYLCCHRHGKLLVTHCPECKVELNYMHGKMSLSHCTCGYALTEFENTKRAPEPLVKLCKWLLNESTANNSDMIFKTQTQRWGAVLWWWLENHDYFDSVENCVLNSAEHFLNTIMDIPCYLKGRINQALDDSFQFALNNDVPHFSDVFGDLLINASRLPSNQLDTNPILCALVQQLEQASEKFICGQQNIRIMLNSLESAVLLFTSTKQIAELIESGRLPLRKRLKKDSAIKVTTPLFALEDVLALWVAGFQSESSNRNMYLSRW